MIRLNPEEKKWAKLLFVFFFFSFSFFYQAGQDNENARLDQARTLVENGEFRINRYSFNTADVVEFEGGVYPNKAPGGTFLIVPHYWLFSTALSFLPVSPATAEHLVCWLINLTSLGLLSALLCAAMFVVLRRMLGRDADALFITLAYGLGTIAFPFSTILFSHQITAALLFLAFAGLYLNKDELSSGAAVNRLGAKLGFVGFLLGYAMTCEYPAAIAAAPIGLYGLWLARCRGKSLVWFIVGGLLGLSFIAIYNLLVFGKLFFVTYSLYAGPKAAFREHQQGFMGVAMPRLQTLLEITFRSQRGLFYCNPWLVGVIPGLFLPIFRKYRTLDVAVSIFIVVGFFAFNAAFAPGIVYSGGGASTGPRHIIPMLPFAAILAARLTDFSFFRKVLYPLAFISVPVMLMSAATEPRVPYEYTNPVKDLFWKNFRDGNFALSRNGTFNNTPLTENSISFNLGKLIGLPGPWQLAPIILFWLGSFIFALSRIEKSSGGRHRTAKLTAFLLALFLVSLAPIRARVQSLKDKGPNGIYGSFVQGVVWRGCAPFYDESISANGRVLVRRKDEKISFDWSAGGSPLAGSFSAQWDGFIAVPEDGLYKFGTSSDDGSCLYINGRLVVDNWGVHGATLKQNVIELRAGRQKITLLYCNEQFGGNIDVLWGRTNTGLATIPKEVFFSDEAPEAARPLESR